MSNREDRRARNRANRARRKQETPRMSQSLANAICDDLPDGAYWAMMEELTGMEPAELVDDLKSPYAPQSVEDADEQGLLPEFRPSNS